MSHPSKTQDWDCAVAIDNTNLIWTGHGFVLQIRDRLSMARPHDPRRFNSATTRSVINWISVSGSEPAWLAGLACDGD